MPISVQSGDTKRMLGPVVISNIQGTLKHPDSRYLKKHETILYDSNPTYEQHLWINHNEEEMLPLEKWGRHFVALAYQQRDIIRILGRIETNYDGLALYCIATIIR